MCRHTHYASVLPLWSCPILPYPIRSDSTKEAGSSKDTSMGAGDVSSNKALVPANGEMGTVLPGGDKHVDIKRYLQSQLEQQVTI